MTLALPLFPPRLQRPCSAFHMLSVPQRSPLCFHNLTNCFSRNRFALITMQIARGGACPEQRRRVPLQRVIVTAQSGLISFFSHSCALFARSEISNSLVFSLFRTLLQNTGGGGSARSKYFNRLFHLSAQIRTSTARRRADLQAGGAVLRDHKDSRVPAETLETRGYSVLARAAAAVEATERSSSRGARRGARAWPV
jgi:hypothetical protein